MAARNRFAVSSLPAASRGHSTSKISPEVISLIGNRPQFRLCHPKQPFQLAGGRRGDAALAFLRQQFIGEQRERIRLGLSLRLFLLPSPRRRIDAVPQQTLRLAAQGARVLQG